MIQTTIRPDADFGRLRKVLLREGLPDRVPFFEIFADMEISEAVLGRSAPRGDDAKALIQRIAHEIAFQHALGYDYVRVTADPPFPSTTRPARNTAALAKGDRGWVVSVDSVIRSRSDLDSFRWPVVADEQFAGLEYANRHLPDGMKIIGTQSGIFEHTEFLLGYENLCIKLAEDRDLVREVFTRVGELQHECFKRIVQYENVAALWYTDDLGFKTQTLISPRDLREFVFPWHKRMVDIAHERGLPALLHCCGNLEEVMENIIDGCGFDAKHSFEDAIMPVEEVKTKYGNRIAILGGIDVDFLTRASADDVRRRTRDVLEHCMPGGGFALGTGNSVANYIPVANYIAMLETGWELGRY
ncbi:MAG: uroporphyrinogen decarboxylase family protein [Planctomycetota bacterium]